MQQPLPDHFAYLLRDAKRKGKNLTKSIQKEKAKKLSKETYQTDLNVSGLEHQQYQEQENHNSQQQQQQNQQLQQLAHEDFSFKTEEKSRNKSDDPGMISIMMEGTETVQNHQNQENPSSLMWKREKHLQTIDLPKKRHVKNAFQITSDLFLYEHADNAKDSFCTEKSYLSVPLGAFKKVRSVTKYDKEGRVELAVWSDGEAAQSLQKQIEQTHISSGPGRTPVINNSSAAESNLNNISDVILSGLAEHAGIKLQQLINQTDFNQYVYAVNFGVDPVTNTRGINMVYYSNSLLQLLGLEVHKNLYKFNSVLDLLQLISPEQNQYQEVKVKIIKESQDLHEKTEASSTPSQLDLSSSGSSSGKHPQLITNGADSIITEDPLLQAQQGNDDASEIIAINTSDFIHFKNLDEATSGYLQQLNMKAGYLRTLDGMSIEVGISHCIEDLGEDYLAMFPETDIAVTAPKFVVSLYKLTITQEQINKVKCQREAIADYQKSNSITEEADEQMKVFLDKFYEKSIKA